MLRIRPEQVEKFKAAAASRFEDWMVGHLKKFFPEKCDEMGEEGMRGMIRHGAKRAEVYGIEQGPDMCLYIDTMFLLGKDFDRDPQHRWAREILESKVTGDGPSKAEKVYSAAEERHSKGRS